MGDGENGGIPSNPTRGPYFPNELSFPYELSRLALGVYFLVGRRAPREARRAPALWVAFLIKWDNVRLQSEFPKRQWFS